MESSSKLIPTPLLFLVAWLFGSFGSLVVLAAAGAPKWLGLTLFWALFIGVPIIGILALVSGRSEQASPSRNDRRESLADFFPTDSCFDLKDELIKKGIARWATVEEYAEWLREYLKRGGKVTHTHDYRMPRDFFLVAQKSFTILDGTCGSRAFNVIVPAGLEVKRAGHDHCHIMDADYNAPGIVPSYPDVGILL